ncbi:MAG: DegQ family serine endoprotease [Proteobacteria bacterium]|nr:DegQ family serine endoprotease [Pseudomonadota bacterium]
MKIKLGIFFLLNIICILPTFAEDSFWMEGSSHQTGVELNLPTFAPVVEKLGKAVVNISIEGTEKVSKKQPFQIDPEGQGNTPFDFFFQMPPDNKNSKRTFNSLGSGFVVNPDGYIVTNQHVVDKATKILITFRDDKKTYEAKLVGSDPKTDIALLKVDYPEKLPAVVLGDSDKLSSGDWVIAIGNPFRLGHTATVGIVSAKSRKFQGGKPYDNFIQTDASINPGNSGGPLFNAKGEVVGVNTAIFSPGRMGTQGFNIGIGFATPINIVKTIIDQLRLKGKVVRGWLGVLIQPVSEDVAEALKLDKAKGALVADVLANSPASKAEIQRGDVIVSFDGHDIQENEDLPLIVADTAVGKTVKVEIIRAGRSETKSVKIEELSDETAEIEQKIPNTSEESNLGLTIQDITPDIAKGLGIEQSKGVVVTDVSVDSVAMIAGLKRGDVILEVGSKQVNTAKEFIELTKGIVAKKPLLLLVRRGDNTIFLTLKVE